jgi:hypothetical protein
MFQKFASLQMRTWQGTYVTFIWENKEDNLLANQQTTLMHRHEHNAYLGIPK